MQMAVTLGAVYIYIYIYTHTHNPFKENKRYR